jgi:hypothetical protein
VIHPINPLKMAIPKTILSMTFWVTDDFVTGFARAAGLLAISFTYLETGDAYCRRND